MNLLALHHVPSDQAPGPASGTALGRPCRVIALAVAIALMSLADLHMTLTYARGIGFAEANPLARWVMSYDCAWLLGSWKLLFLAITIGIFLHLRHTRAAEIASWLSLVVMLWLMGQWSQYADKVPQLTSVMHQLTAADIPTFVRMTD